MFKAINYILFEKNKKELDNEILSEFVPHMVSRYLSFYDKEYVSYINDTINTYGNIFDCVEDRFKFYDAVIPKVRKRKIDYVKKIKKEEKEEQVPIPEFYSSREMKMLTKKIK